MISTFLPAWQRILLRHQTALSSSACPASDKLIEDLIEELIEAFCWLPQHYQSASQSWSFPVRLDSVLQITKYHWPPPKSLEWWLLETWGISILFASLSLSAVLLSSRKKVHFGSRSAEKSFFLHVLLVQLQLLVLFISSDSGICLGGLGRCSAFVL